MTIISSGVETEMVVRYQVDTTAEGAPVFRQKTLRLTFTTTLGSTFTITLPAPRADLTAVEAEAAMELICTARQWLPVLRPKGRSYG